MLVNGAGPTVLMRADTDALPVTEQTGLPYASTLAILVITLMVPKQTGRISPKPQVPPDAVVAAGSVECPLCHGEGVIHRDVGATTAGTDGSTGPPS